MCTYYDILYNVNIYTDIYVICVAVPSQKLKKVANAVNVSILYILNNKHGVETISNSNFNTYRQFLIFLLSTFCF